MLLACMDDRAHVGDRVAEIGDPCGPLTGSQLVSEVDQSGRIRLVRGITHGDQGGIHQPQPLLQHIAGRWGLGATHAAPANAGGAEVVEQLCLHQQGLITDEATPVRGVCLRIPAEVKVAEDFDECVTLRDAGTAATQQLEAGVPVVVPVPLGLEPVDVGGAGLPAAVMGHRLLQGTAVAARYIADHPVDVEQQDGE